MFRPSGRSVRGGAVLALVLALAGCTATAGGPNVVASGGATTVHPVRTTPSATRTPTPAHTRTTTPTTKTPASPTPTATPASSSPASTSSFDRSKHSLDDPRSIWVVVDKRRPLQPKSWVPPDLVTPAVPHTNVPQLRRVAAAALVRMFAAAKQDGISLVSLSAYRSFASQRSIFDRNVASLGRATTLQLTAKPGFSEHQTGLADDLGDGTSCDLQVCFESHPAARWLTVNAWRYGYVQRYPPGYTKITGIQVEPWHFRYIGASAAREMRATGVRTLEQFFGLPAAPRY